MEQPTSIPPIPTPAFHKQQAAMHVTDRALAYASASLGVSLAALLGITTTDLPGAAARLALFCFALAVPLLCLCIVSNPGKATYERDDTKVSAVALCGGLLLVILGIALLVATKSVLSSVAFLVACILCFFTYANVVRK